MRGLEAGQYRPLTESDIHSINETSIDILQEPGVQCNNIRALDMFEKNGAVVDRETKKVRIPRGMLEDAIASAPSRVTLCGRNDKDDLLLEGKRTHLGTGGTVLNVLDMETGKRRQTVIEDMKNFARLVDALDNVHFFMLPLYPNDIDVEDVDVNRFWWAMANTTKHVMGGVYTIDGVRNVINIAEHVAGSANKLRERPFISMVTCMMSPLIIDDTYGGLLMEVASHGIPVVCPAEPLAGATGPITLAGTVAVSNAESLAGVVLAQLTNRGTPTIYGTVATTMDMKSGYYLSGSIESGLINAACAQMAQFYQLPVYATAGMSDSKLPDIQAGYEKMATNIITALAGANYIHDAAGFLEFCTTISYEQMVIDDEIIGICMRAVKGIDTSLDSLARDVIKSVGAGGNFLTSTHTMKYCRSEFLNLSLGDRKSRKRWEKDGAKDCAERAKEKARRILAEHSPEPIPSEILENIRSVYPQLNIQYSSGGVQSLNNRRINKRQQDGC
ncbi:MAG: trimethylamine methyltransferase family protein [Clostridiales bacterium]|nr:trimethylamine methyltransferase family protein [Clostridiales bacterium]MCF8023243.1 trimethylamine methyltransferase family protein [Clostridiales bacterium]